MDLSRVIGLAAVVLIVVVAAGYAVAEAGADAPEQSAAAAK